MTGVKNNDTQKNDMVENLLCPQFAQDIKNKITEISKAKDKNFYAVLTFYDKNVML